MPIRRRAQELLLQFFRQKYLLQGGKSSVAFVSLVALGSVLIIAISQAFKLSTLPCKSTGRVRRLDAR